MTKATTPRSPRPAPGSNRLDPADKVKILLVDDRPENLVALRAILSEPGYELVTASSGKDALKALLREDFALILLDVIMPGMDGYAVASIVRSRDRTADIPILFLTAVATDLKQIHRGYASGAVDYLMKPLDPDLVRAKVSVFARLYRKEQELASQAAELARSNAELEAFAYVASHDLREPLRAIQSYATLLQRQYQGKLDPKADHFIEHIVNGSKRMGALIADLLTYSRAGRSEGPDEEVNLETLLKSVLQGLQEEISQSGAGITVRPLPKVIGNPTRLGQVFQNLISNSIKFRGTEAPRILISAERGRAEWVFTVEDNGIGIDPSQRDRVFGIFQRLHTSTEYPGTGIGLSICKKIVERHGGRIWVESEPGKGAKFRFTLPAEIQLESEGDPLPGKDAV